MVSDKLYDGLRFLVQVLLPGAGTLYFLLQGADSVLGGILVAVFVLGVLLRLSQRVYAKRIGHGDLLVEEDADGAAGLRLALEQTPEELVAQREVRFKVKHVRADTKG